MNCRNDSEYYTHGDLRYLNVLFLALITSGWSTSKINVIRKLLSLNQDHINGMIAYNPNAIKYHSLESISFYDSFIAISPDVFKSIDPNILRLLIQHTEHEDENGNIFGERNGLGPILFFLRHQQEEQEQQDFSSFDDNDKNAIFKSVTITSQVKVILEESCDTVARVLCWERYS
jgi:hypothetical protein